MLAYLPKIDLSQESEQEARDFIVSSHIHRHNNKVGMSEDFVISLKLSSCRFHHSFCVLVEQSPGHHIFDIVK